ncbi:MAG: GyrI-like domain-containing protein [Clostridia bacterium]|nr:GyrI-like domain-containing protein [Clostridia bacterium]
MAAKIVDFRLENCPKARFIGKRYVGSPNWGEWWENGWFDVLEQLPQLPINDNAYLGALRVADGVLEYWIGMFFEADTPVPDGFDFADTDPMSYAVYFLYGSEQSGELFGLERHNMCLEDLKARGITRFEDNWCIERCNCPRFTTPDEHGNVVLDYLISVE